MLHDRIELSTSPLPKHYTSMNTGVSVAYLLHTDADFAALSTISGASGPVTLKPY